MKNAAATLTRCAIIAMVALLVSGCTMEMPVSQAVFKDYPQSAKTNASVQLVLTPEFSSFTDRYSWMGDTHVTALGAPLSSNAEEMTRRLFTEVQVSREPLPAKPLPGVQAMLSPRAVAFKRAMGATAFSEMKQTMEVEWTLSKPNGDIVWMATVQGMGKTDTGNMFTYKARNLENSGEMFEDLFTKSFAAISEAPEIRSYVAP